MPISDLSRWRRGSASAPDAPALLHEGSWLYHVLPPLLGPASVVMVLGCIYFWMWRDVAGFIAALGKNRWLFEDFIIYFHPMGRDVLLLREPIFGYFYPAFFALLMVPLGAMESGQAAWIWGALQVLALAGVCLIPLRRILRLTRFETAVYLAVCLSSLPLFINFSWGQMGMLLTLLALAGVDASLRHGPLRAGLFLAVAASIKYYMGFFLLFLLWRRQRRATLAFLAGGFACFAIFPALLLGPRAWLDFHLQIARNLATVDWIAPDPNSQYVAHVGLRWLGLPPLGNPDAATAGFLLKAAGLILVALTLLAAWRIERRRHPAAPALLASAVFLSFPFLLTTSWPHYFVYLPFCQAAVLHALREDSGLSAPGQLVLAACPIISIVVSNVFFFTLFGDRIAYHSAGFLFLADALLLIPILVLGLRIRRDPAAMPNDPLGA